MDPDPGGLKTCGSGSATLALEINFVLNFILQALVQSAQNLYERRGGFGSRSGAGSVSGPMTNRSGWPNIEKATKKLKDGVRISNGLMRRCKVRAGEPGC